VRIIVATTTTRMISFSTTRLVVVVGTNGVAVECHSRSFRQGNEELTSNGIGNSLDFGGHHPSSFLTFQRRQAPSLGFQKSFLTVRDISQFASTSTAAAFGSIDDSLVAGSAGSIAFRISELTKSIGLNVVNQRLCVVPGVCQFQHIAA